MDRPGRCCGIHRRNDSNTPLSRPHLICMAVAFHRWAWRNGETSMSTTVTKERMALDPTNRSGVARVGAGETSPRLMARIAGVLYLLTILMGMFSAGFATAKIVVSGDAPATANNILAHRGLFQLAFAVYLIEMACQVALTALFYSLLKPAGKSVSL